MIENVPRPSAEIGSNLADGSWELAMTKQDPEFRKQLLAAFARRDSSDIEALSKKSTHALLSEECTRILAKCGETVEADAFRKIPESGLKELYNELGRISQTASLNYKSKIKHDKAFGFLELAIGYGISPLIFISAGTALTELAVSAVLVGGIASVASLVGFIPAALKTRKLKASQAELAQITAAIKNPALPAPAQGALPSPGLRP